MLRYFQKSRKKENSQLNQSLSFLLHVMLKDFVQKKRKSHKTESEKIQVFHYRNKNLGALWHSVGSDQKQEGDGEQLGMGQTLGCR